MRFIRNKKAIKKISVSKKLMFLRYIFFFALKKKKSKIHLYKTLHFAYNLKNKIIDYFNIDYVIKKKKDVLGFSDFFYLNQALFVKQIVPMFLSKFKYNLYNKNYIIFKIIDYFKLKKINWLYLQGLNYSNFNYLYFLNFYNYLINNICLNYQFVLLSYYVYNTNFNIINRFKFINIIKSINFEIDNCIKFKSNFNIKNMKVLNKYLIRARMFRAGKMFFNFLNYMKRFSYSAYTNNLFYRKIKYMKLNGTQYNNKLVFLNIDKFTNIKGWFYIYNYIKKYSFLAAKEKRNQNKMISYFVKQYHYLYCFIIKFFYKILYNLKFLFIDKFSFKKFLFLKIVLFFMYHKKMCKFRRFRRLIQKRKFKKWRLKRVLKIRNLWYIRFLFKIKYKIFNKKFLKRIKLGKLIKQRKRRTYFKFKNRMRIVNWLRKFKRLKGFKHPLRKFKNFKYKKFKQQFLNKKKQLIDKKVYVKRV